MRVDFLVHGKLLGTADTVGDGVVYTARYAELETKRERASNVDCVTYGTSWTNWRRISDDHYQVEVVDPATVTTHNREN